MAQEVTVTPAEIERARLVVSLNDSLNKKTPASIRKIAAARPRSTNGAARDRLS